MGLASVCIIIFVGDFDDCDPVPYSTYFFVEWNFRVSAQHNMYSMHWDIH